MRPTVLFCAVLFTWFGIESGNTQARLMLTAFASVPVGATPYAIPPGSALRNPDAGEFGRLAQTPNMLAPEDPAQQAWATVQDTTDPAVLEDFIRRFANTSYADLARARLTDLNDPVGRAWVAVQTTPAPAALDDFIRRFGNTKYGDLARARLTDLNDPAGRAWAAVQNT